MRTSNLQTRSHTNVQVYFSMVVHKGMGEQVKHNLSERLASNTLKWTELTVVYIKQLSKQDGKKSLACNPSIQESKVGSPNSK